MSAVESKKPNTGMEIELLIAESVRLTESRPLGDHPKLRKALKGTTFRVEDNLVSTEKDDERLVVCGLFEPRGMVRDFGGDNVSLLIDLVDLDGHVKQVLIPMAELQIDPRKSRGRLADAGLFIANRNLFDFLLASVRPPERIRLARQPGWHGNVFVTPDGRAVGQIDEEVRLENALCDQVAGALDAQIDVLRAAFDSGVDHFALAVLVSVAGSIVQRIGLPDTPILALVGESTKGKTTALSIAASSFGDPRPNRGLLSTLRTTANAIEATAARSNGTVLCLDEAAHLANDEAQSMMFTIAGGASKSRMTRAGGLRPAHNWSTFSFISSEQGIAQKIAAGRTPMMNGAAVRCIEVDVSAAPSLPRATMDVIASHKVNFGHVGPLVAELLAHEDPAFVSERVARHTNDLIGVDADPLARRGASIFGILIEAGSLLQRVGVLDEDSDVRGVVKRTWERYRSSPDADRLRPNQKAATTLRDKLFMSMDVQFLPVGDEHPVREPLGWYEHQGKTVTFYVPTTKLVSLSGDAVGRRSLCSELEREGILITPTGKNRTWTTIPKSNRPISHYRLRYALGASEE